MDDLSAAISGFLSKPGAMEQLETVAKQLGLSTGTDEGEKTTDTASVQESNLGMIDGISPEKLQKIMQAVQDGGRPDRNTALLEALRPLLHSEKQEKMDRAIRAIRLMHMARSVSKTIEL